MDSNPVLVSDEDYEAAARERLSASVYGYFAGAAEDEVTLRENRSAWDRVKVVPRVLVDVSRRSLATTVLGTPIRFPVMTAPCAFNALADPEGEKAVARAAAAVGTVQVLSTGAAFTIEEVAEAAAGPRWFQLYCVQSLELSLRLVGRAEAAGYSAIVLTVDVPILGRRDRDVRTGFELPEGMGWKSLEFEGAAGKAPVVGGGAYRTAAQMLASGGNWTQTLDWNFLEKLCAATKLPVLVKGVLSPADALLAVERGARGVVVSNHGGRQLDGSLATAEALAPVVDAVAGRAEVFVDGGIRRGSHVLKALALGARAVLIGRPYLWGLAARGEAGVVEVLTRFRDEFDVALALAGKNSPQEVDRSLLAPAGPPR